MGYIPVFGGGNTSAPIGYDTSTTTMTEITNGGVANTKGSWVQLIASTARNATGIVLSPNIGATTVTNQDGLFDIGFGAGGSEVAVIQNLHACTNAGGQQHARNYHIPIQIPAGTRIACRQQSTSTTCTIKMGATLLYGGIHTPTYGIAESVGVATGTSLATALSHPASNNTKGSYVQITASTSRRYTGLIIHSGKGQANATQFWLMDVAIGGAGSEKIILADIGFSQNTTTDAIETAQAGPFMVDIPSGTRIAVRIQIDVTGAGRDMWASVVGLI